MKKLGILCALLLVAAVAVMAQDAVDLFSDIDAVALSGEEMKAVVGEGPSKVLMDSGVDGMAISEMRVDKKLRDHMDSQERDRAAKDRRNSRRFGEAAYGVATIGAAFIPGCGPYIAAGMGGILLIGTCSRDTE